MTSQYDCILAHRSTMPKTLGCVLIEDDTNFAVDQGNESAISLSTCHSEAGYKISRQTYGTSSDNFYGSLTNKVVFFQSCKSNCGNGWLSRLTNGASAPGGFYGGL
jgi:hypothetical protein